MSACRPEMSDDEVVFVTEFRKVDGVWQRRRQRKDTGGWLDWMTLTIEEIRPKRGEARTVWRWKKK